VKSTPERKVKTKEERKKGKRSAWGWGQISNKTAEECHQCKRRGNRFTSHLIERVNNMKQTNT